MEERLIEAVRGRKFLYDTSHADYMRSKLKLEMWNEVAKEINMKNAYLKGKDLTTTSAKKVESALEEKLEINLTSRKKEVGDIDMACIEESEKKGGNKAKKNGNKDDDDEDGDEEEGDEETKEEEEDEKEEEEEEEEEKEEEKPKKNCNKDDDGDEEEGDEDTKEEEEDEKEEEEEEEEEKENSKRATPKKTGSSYDSVEGFDAEDKSDEECSPDKKAKGKKMKGSDSDSDEDWKGAGKKGEKTGAIRGGGGGKFNKTCTLTPELAALVGSDQMARHEVVKRVWSIIKEKNLYDPRDKQYAICNKELMKVIGTKRFWTFRMMKYLKKHFLD